MARIFIDGFESGMIDLWEDPTGRCSASTTIVASGNYSLKVPTTTGDNNYLKKVLSANYTTFYCKFRAYVSSQGGDSGFVQFADGTTAQVTLGLTSTRRVSIRRGGYSGTLLGYTIWQFPLNTWTLIEMYCVIDNAVGATQVKIDGVTHDELTLTNQDTQVSANAYMNVVYLGDLGGTADYAHGYRDDFVLDDSAWPGNSRIQGVVPTGAGTTTQWTPSVGSNWQTVDEVPASDADYNSINANDQLDTFAMGNLAGSIDNIKCVQVHARAWKEGAVTPQNLKIAVRSGGTNYLSGNTAVPDTNAIGIPNLWETDPNTAVAWTEGGVNAMEAGYKSAA